MGDLSSSLSSVPVVFLEVVPVILIENEQNDSQQEEEQPVLTNFGVKEHLRRFAEEAALKSMLGSAVGNSNNTHDTICIQWEESKEPTDNSSTLRLHRGYLFQSTASTDQPPTQKDEQFPLLYLPSEDPTVLDPFPCCVTAFAYRERYVAHGSATRIMVTEDALVRILPLKVATMSDLPNQPSLASTALTLPGYVLQDAFLQDLLGETGNDFLTESMQQEVLQNRNPETIQQLSLKMTTILSKSIHVGTTKDAMKIQKERKIQMNRMKQSLFAYCELNSDRADLAAPLVEKGNSTRASPTTTRPDLWWPSLLVHSPNHADGKTLVVQAVAKTIGCSRIHIIRPSILLAKYGSQADAALESQLHAILVSAACHNQSVCVILDQMDMMLPPRLSGRSGAGDAALPIFNATASYLRNVTSSMQRHREFPFPIKNVLYNHSGSSGGQVLSVNLCLVGIVTCPDDGWKAAQRSQGMGNGGSSILDCMVCDRYRLPLLTAQTRLAALKAAFAREEISLDASSTNQLPIAAASAAWAKGGAFQRIARRLKQLDSKAGDLESKKREASLQDLQRAIAFVKEDSPSFAQVSFQMQQTESSLNDGNATGSYFDSIGGNAQAKASLEDALALDPTKRMLLSRFGLSPPTGVLLYGPPGCGKTLLAKAVASLLKSPSLSGDCSSGMPGGGTFVSLAISDVVSAEVGTSEKMIKSSFEFADKNAPSVFFLDEFQALFTDRSRGGSSKLTTTLLQCLDDIKRWYDADKAHESRVSVIAATNTPWMIDSAFLRPGRFDRVVHVGLPSMKERESILFLLISKMKLQTTEKSKGAKSLSKALSKKTEGFSGADLAALCRAAAVRALFENLEETEVTESHFREALKMDVSPSSDDDLVRRLLQWRP